MSSCAAQPDKAFDQYRARCGETAHWTADCDLHALVHSCWIVYWPAVELPLLVTFSIHLEVEMVYWRECWNAPCLPLLPLPPQLSFPHSSLLLTLCLSDTGQTSRLSSRVMLSGVLCFVAVKAEKVLWDPWKQLLMGLHPVSWQLDISHAFKTNAEISC